MNRLIRVSLCGLSVFTFVVAAAAQESLNMSVDRIEPAWELVVGDQHFPEGPAWDGKGSLYFSNCHAGTIHRITHESLGSALFVQASADPFTIKNTNGLTFGPDGFLYACEYGIPGILRITPDGSTEYIARGHDGKPLVRPNDLMFDAVGNLYFTDSWAYKRENPEGAVYRIDASTRTLTRAAGGLAFPNGLAFTPDGKHLIVAESAWNRLLRYRVADDGSLTDREVFAEMPGGDPDGMNFDTEGNLWVAHFGGGVVVVFDQDGRRLRELKAPGKKPSNVEFAGVGLRTLYLTEDETNGVYRLNLDALDGVTGG